MVWAVWRPEFDRDEEKGQNDKPVSSDPVLPMIVALFSSRRSASKKMTAQRERMCKVFPPIVCAHTSLSDEIRPLDSPSNIYTQVLLEASNGSSCFFISPLTIGKQTAAARLIGSSAMFSRSPATGHLFQSSAAAANSHNVSRGITLLPNVHRAAPCIPLACLLLFSCPSASSWSQY
jgi:hypothetical protein